LIAGAKFEVDLLGERVPAVAGDPPL
jgi:hypothetical protein